MSCKKGLPRQKKLTHYRTAKQGDAHNITAFCKPGFTDTLSVAELLNFPLRVHSLLNAIICSDNCSHSSMAAFNCSWAD